MPGKLPHKLVKQIELSVSTLFDKVKDRFFGPHAGPKRIVIGYNRDLSLPGIYSSAHIQERSVPDKETLNGLIRVAENYLDAEKHKAIAKAVNAVQSAISNQAYYDQDPAKIQTTLLDTLSDVFREAKVNVARIVDSETQRGKNTGTLEGVIKANQNLGISDPVIFFVVVKDGLACDHCKRVHLMPDGVTPRLWYLSEVSHGYATKDQNYPSIGDLHPNGRCVLTTLIKGFDVKGNQIVWVGRDYDAIKEQRGT